MNLQYRSPSIELRPTSSWLLCFITIAILTSIVKGSHSVTVESTNKTNQSLYSDLTGITREISSIRSSDDADKHFQSSLNSYEQEQLLEEGYRLVNFEDVISSFQTTIPDEGSTDGSGTSTEETTAVTVTSTTQSTTTVHLSTSDFQSTASATSTSETTSEVSSQNSTSTSTTTEKITTETQSSITATTEMTTTATTDTTTIATITTTNTTIIATTTTTEMATITTTNTTAITTITTTAATTIATTVRPQVCIWTSWVPITNCTPQCGPAYRIVVRLCVDVTTGQSCSNSLCGDGSAVQNETCSSSPPCETISVIPPTTDRDPSIRIISYALPDTMYFFEQTYRRIWISNKGYITFDTPYYARTMTTSAFQQINNQAIAAPFWADMSYISNYSNIIINWFSSTNATGSDASIYNDVIQSVIKFACPTSFCSTNFAAARVTRITWQNLLYEFSSVNKSINVSFSAYLINTYEYDSSLYSYPVLRSYIVFDYTNLPSDLGYFRPFVGYRGKNFLVQILNDQSYYQNALFLTQRSKTYFYVGGRFLSQCEVSFLQETRINILYPWENLNDIRINPRFPCPCTLRQAQIDTRFGRLFSETQYELSQNIVCYAPRTTSWINISWKFQLLRSQTCCYQRFSQGLITFGSLAGSVLSNPYILFLPYPWQRRIPFYDQCCSPSYITGRPDWGTCHFYFQLHPPSSCTGYRPPAIVTGVGDPHVNTIDNGRYTCHIQGLFVFAQTTPEASATAQSNLNNNASNIDLIYPDDLFEIRVRSVFVPPALSYIERTHGYGSIFSSYTIIAVSFTFVISNNNGKFDFSVNNNATLTNDLSNNFNYDYINTMNYTERYIYRVQQTTRSILNATIPQLTISLWSGLSMQFEIIGENLECKLILPEKFRTHIEGLVGNFNGKPNDDLFNRQTNQIIPITDLVNITVSRHDEDVLNACLSWKVPSDTTSDNRIPIMPRSLVEWYYKNASNLLTSLNPSLNQIVVNRTCHDNFECIHDYLIRINSFTSEVTALGLELIQESRIVLAEIPPTINLTLPVKIISPIDNTNRNYSFEINIMPDNGTTIKSAYVTIYPSNRTQNITNNGLSSITVLMPNNVNDSVEVLLTIQYGSNFTFQTYLDILACLCTNNGTCNFEETTTISDHYQLASCDCPAQYDGILCQLDYDGCTSGSACKVNWDNKTTCVRLNATQQQEQNRSYYCDGTCVKGYIPVDNFTCEDENECSLNSSLCGNGVCINLIGSYTCNCSSGYRFYNETCVDINECTEPNINGTFIRRCIDACRDQNYGYGCKQSCECVHGKCNRNATHVNESCICDPIYQPPLCIQLIDQCAINNSPCNNTIEDCSTDPNSGTAICTCKLGYEKDNTTMSCTDINECAKNASTCNPESSICYNTFGNYTCNCKDGYESIVGSCIDINECLNSISCANYTNTYCVNIGGLYECRCTDGYSVGGDRTQTYKNILNTPDSCLLTDYSSDCENQCIYPAECRAATGRCACPNTIFNFILFSSAINQTCQCPGHPFVHFTGEKCIAANANNPTWFIIEIANRIKQSIFSELELNSIILRSLSQINSTYNTADVQIKNTSVLKDDTFERYVGLNISLNATQRLQLVNEIYKNIPLNTSYTLTVQIIINQKSGKIEKITEVQPSCMECQFMERGVCSMTSNDTCRCFSDFEGYLCRLSKAPPSRTWIIIVAVISAVAGLLLLISLSMCIFYIIGKRSRSKNKETKQSTGSKKLTIPRVRPPTMGTTSKNTVGLTDSSRAKNDEQTNDTSDTNSSDSTTTHNPIYHRNENSQHTSLARGSIPQKQMHGMANTLNSIPRDPKDDSSGTANLFPDSHDINEIEFTTDLLDDMIKDDDNIEDDFIEAINPNIVIPK
ncbi:unnamed protein product [Rotaria sp. Silwood1]|nr:unnamed protein product [Rotaria sp. Silwood1]